MEKQKYAIRYKDEKGNYITIKEIYIDPSTIPTDGKTDEMILTTDEEGRKTIIFKANLEEMNDEQN